MIFKTEDAKGVISLLLPLSGYAAMERGSEVIEPKDLIKAIYIFDLEHVARFWDDWENFEKVILDQELVGSGQRQAYLNRMLYLIRLELVGRENSGSFVGLGKPSRALLDIVDAARKLATERLGASATPSTRDFLFCICLQDPELSAVLEISGLKIKELEAAVKKRST